MRERNEQDESIRALNRRWHDEHRRNVRRLEKQLMADNPGASSAERLLISSGAHEAAVAELLGRCQLLLAKRVEAFMDSPPQALRIARVLAEATACRNSTSRRVEELLHAAATLRAQRSNAESKPKTGHLRRVA